MQLKQKFVLPAFFFIFTASQGLGQTGRLEGVVTDDRGHPLEAVSVVATTLHTGTVTDKEGVYLFKDLPAGKQKMIVSAIGFEEKTFEIIITSESVASQNITLRRTDQSLGDIVITGTMKSVHKSESPVLVQAYPANFLKKSASSNVFEALSNINGVRPQNNCNVCNTGDVHINGLEGPYTMMMIDGMPVMSALGTVYGFSGIPTSLIERVEVVKGPASTLYGSEAMGGLINIITKNPQNQPLISIDQSATTWGEYNTDVAVKFNIGKKASALTGVNYYNFQNVIDKDHDHFTDKTLQHRISVFQKWNFERDKERLFTLAARYMYEDRWGGEIGWNKMYRGSGPNDPAQDGRFKYGESIYTNRVEAIGNYQLPTLDNMFFQFSFINHDQNSAYGDEWYIANQKVFFGQLTWNKALGKHDLLSGAALRYTYYDDNTPATAKSNGIDNAPEKTYLPGIFLQDDIRFSKAHRLLLGARYDYNNIHGNIFTPRLAYKWAISDRDIVRINTGTGYRVVNVFNEDHSALTGGRDVIIKDNLKPERSYNVSADYSKQIYSASGNRFGLDAGVFYTYFTNRIIGDYETSNTKIVYDNLDGHSQSKGANLSLDMNFISGLNILIGATILRNTVTTRNDDGKMESDREMHAESFNGTWTASYPVFPLHLAIDYTGYLYGPMRLPLMGDLDPRPEYSPWYSIQNIQFTYKGFKNIEIYAGVKNLLNWTVGRNKTSKKYFNIARPFDPFNQHVQFGPNGEPVAVTDVPASDPRYNPYALVFDPDSYVYAPNQGRSAIWGIRFSIR